MKFKKSLSMLLCIILMLGIVGCTKDTPTDAPKDNINSETTFKPGTYTATSKGNNGDVTVEVVLMKSLLCQ